MKSKVTVNTGTETTLIFGSINDGDWFKIFTDDKLYTKIDLEHDDDNDTNAIDILNSEAVFFNDNIKVILQDVEISATPHKETE